MASSSSFMCLLPFFLLYLYSTCMAADPNSSFSFENGNFSNFESQLALHGDAKVANDSMSVEIAGSGVSSAGWIIYKKPIDLVEGKSGKMVSFSNYFVFSMSREIGDGLAFVMLPAGLPLNVSSGEPIGILEERKIKFLAVDFNTSRDEKYNYVNGNHVGIDVGSPISVRVSNVSSIKLVLHSAEKLQAWIDYEAGSQNVEVRLSKFGDNRPTNPLLSYPIDLSKMWKEENVIVGLSSSSRNSSQKCNIYAWSFRSRTVPHWMHSKPLDPWDFTENGEMMKIPKKSDCAMRILLALIFGTGFGALGAFFLFFLWNFFGNRRPVVPEEFAVELKAFQCDKLNVSVGEDIEDGKK